MTVNETKTRIEAALSEIADSFGKASNYVSYSVQISENEIEGDTTDITYIFGSLAIGKPGADENDKLYLPLDAELDDDDNVNADLLEKNIEDFKATVAPIRDRLLSADDTDAEVENIIADFDRDMEEKYRAEIERLNRVAKKNLVTAALAAVAMLVIATIILVLDKIG